MKKICRDPCDFIKYKHRSVKYVDPGDGAIITFSQSNSANTLGYIGFSNDISNSSSDRVIFYVPRNGIITNLSVGVNILTADSPGSITVSIIDMVQLIIYTFVTSEYTTTGLVNFEIDRTLIPVPEGANLSVILSSDDMTVMGSFTFL